MCMILFLSEPTEDTNVSDITVKTNHHRLPIMDSCELTLSEQSEFDYLDWSALREGNDSRSFVRYRGRLYDLSDICESVPSDTPNRFYWHGYQSDSFYSGVLVRFEYEADGYESDSVIMGTLTC